MRIAILDPAAGISGDMTLGALLDAGVERAWLESLPARVGFPDVRVSAHEASRNGIRAMKVDFTMPHAGHGEHGRTVGELIEIVRRADISEGVRATAIKAFELVGEAEGRVHGVEPAAVHLHEVGAVDAVLDIVGAVEGFERLGVTAVYNLPVALGTGWVDAAHGKLPIPAPATAILLEGVDITSGGPVTGEATTPTGAALVRVLSQGAPPPAWRAVATGWGAGTRDPHGYPNALRLFVAEAAAEAATIEVIATDIDDMAPEYLEPLRQALFRAGALDCQVWPTQGKKGRISARLEVQVPGAAAEQVISALWANSTTIGVRKWTALRWTLPRQTIEVELAPGVRVRIKVNEGPTASRMKAEYEDVIAAAAALGRPALDVAREAEQRADAVRQQGESAGTTRQ
jgi:uncharacterized protein (TIGR00299 family) protein